MASVPIGNNSSPAPSPPTVQPLAPALAVVQPVVGTQGLQERPALSQPQGPLPPAISPDQILDYAPRKARVLRVDANVVAYFGDMLHSLRGSLSSSSLLPLGKSGNKHPK